MEVFIYPDIGKLETNGGMLYDRAGIGKVKVHHKVHTGACQFKTYSRQHPNGISVGGKDKVTMIVGGRKSIARELNAHNLLLMPAPGQNLAMSVIKQQVQVAPEGRLIGHAFRAPEYAVKAAEAEDGGILDKLSAGAHYFAGIHEAIEEARKKYVFIQLYSGPPDAGDHAVGNGGGAVSSQALVVQLQALPGWST